MAKAKEKKESVPKRKKFSLVGVAGSAFIGMINGITMWMLGAAAHKAAKILTAAKNADPDLDDYDAEVPALTVNGAPALTAE
jgi:hypothetical protein